MYLFPTRIAVVAPVASPSVHSVPVHTATSDVGIELPETWQQYQLSGGATPSFWHHGTPPSGTTYYGHPPHSPYPPLQIFYHFPSIYFQNFYGTFNI
ncbi:hypothetical protein [Bacillus pseudomycoides]|uniref:hypothetical protein n=1 Tax=Bacillus pseudomycoides TaxID=64104 RepID=UPI0023D9E8EC|nr:hypothetical protein [Bacillus pseudomycoides]MDF2084154.1 hypothetical protein [Bacillus pseudomycoides]